MADVVSRSGWNARAPKVAPTRLAASEGILVHHLGDGVKRDPARTDYPALMRQTQNFHMDGRGWNDFAYGWAVGGGKVYEGRGWGWIDGADTGRGRVMHSVLWLGDSYVNQPPQADLDAIAQVVDEHDRRYGHHTIGGHRDVNATGCPGDGLYAWLTAGRPTSTPSTPAQSGAHRKDAYMARHQLFQTGPGLSLMAEVGIGAFGIVTVRAQTEANSNFTPWFSLHSDEDPQPFPAVEVTGGTNADGRQEIVAYAEDGRSARKVRNLDGTWRLWAPEG